MLGRDILIRKKMAKNEGRLTTLNFGVCQNETRNIKDKTSTKIDNKAFSTISIVYLAKKKIIFLPKADLIRRFTIPESVPKSFVYCPIYFFPFSN